MSRTHIAVGIASALAIAQTGSPASCLAAVVGGSLGGIVADCDIAPSRAHRDALVGRLLAGAIAAIGLAVDARAGLGLGAYLVEHLGAGMIVGIVLFASLTFAGARTAHRTFAHSLLAMAGFCAAVRLACAPICPYFAIGYASHLVLDVTNRQPVELFFPMRAGVCLGLCSAKGVVNAAALSVGTAASLLLLAYRLAPLWC